MYYENWRNNKEVPETDEDKMKLAKLKVDWQSFEDNHPWEFDYFWKKVYDYANNWEERYHGNDDYEYEIEMESSKRDNNYPHAYKDKEWRMRNGTISVKCKTGGASGGSCWDTGDDDGAQPYSTGLYLEISDITAIIEHLLYSIFGRNHAFADVPKLIEKLKTEYRIIHEDSYCENEYYGNYTDYNFYYISLWDLYQFLAKNGAF